jgi:hypothetical protein
MIAISVLIAALAAAAIRLYAISSKDEWPNDTSARIVVSGSLCVFPVALALISTRLAWVAVPVQVVAGAVLLRSLWPWMSDHDT